MARIQLKDCTLSLLDGLSGTAAINEAVTPPAENDTEFDIDTIVLNTDDTDLIPLGARFTVAGETVGTTVHTVTARTPSATSPTTNITFTPALGAGTYVDGGVVTFLSQKLEVKLGDGEAKWSVSKNYNYDLDRGTLDTVRAGDEVPMDFSLTATFDQVKSGTSDPPTPVEALDGSGGQADEWVNYSSDACEPYCVGVLIEDVRDCAAANSRDYLFPDFRYEKADFDIKNATISISGKCNAVAPTVTVAS